MSTSVVILAAGQGTRMRSGRPKVLHELAGVPLLQHVIRTARQLQPSGIHVVYGYGGEQVPETLAGEAVNWVFQEQQLGTGHALDQVMPAIADAETLLVLYGDVPLIRAETLAPLVEKAGGGVLAVLTAVVDEPDGYGRILRSSDGRLTGIVEHRDASPTELEIREINTGFLAAPAQHLRAWLRRLDNDNAQGEYYLTDVIGLAAAGGTEVETVNAVNEYEILGVNDRVQLSRLERIYQRGEAERLMRSGVTIADPDRLDIRGELHAGNDCSVDVNVVFEGRVQLGERVRVGPNCVIRNVTAADDVEILANCVIEDCSIGVAARVGPFTRIRPETELAERVHIGNFVEIKKSRIAAGSKVNHLSYIGDTRMGSDVNVGAGTIVCNYDGANKHQTEIGKDVFIGSDTQLIAPVKVGDGATIGAGSTITREVPPGELTLSRCPQQTRRGWKRPVKKGK
jgi:bifunctional UDP-N-acetylglucosamine pyrophosphorylase/glucosamine-1-phosphate N-acetyltransferase